MWDGQSIHILHTMEEMNISHPKVVHWIRLNYQYHDSRYSSTPCRLLGTKPKTSKVVKACFLDNVPSPNHVLSNLFPPLLPRRLPSWHGVHCVGTCNVPSAYVPAGHPSRASQDGLGKRNCVAADSAGKTGLPWTQQKHSGANPRGWGQQK